MIYLGVTYLSIGLVFAPIYYGVIKERNYRNYVYNSDYFKVIGSVVGWFPMLLVLLGRWIGKRFGT